MLEVPDDLIPASPDAARILGVDRATVSRKIANGEIRAWIIGGRRRRFVSRADVERLAVLRREPIPAVPAAERSGDLAERIARYVAGLVDSAPPLTPEQRDRLRTLLAAGGAA